MSRDGFATLTAGMMVRRHELPFASERGQQTLRTAPPMPGPDPRKLVDLPQQHERREVPADDRAYYNGPERAEYRPRIGDADHEHQPERRQRDVSPVVERRHSVPPRVKTSIRLEQHRYVRMRLASNVLERTHQDLMISAIDAYLDSLHVPLFDPQKRYLK